MSERLTDNRFSETVTYLRALLLQDGFRVIAVLGRSGSGKTTLRNTLIAFLPQAEVHVCLATVHIGSVHDGIRPPGCVTYSFGGRRIPGRRLVFMDDLELFDPANGDPLQQVVASVRSCRDGKVVVFADLDLFISRSLVLPQGIEVITLPDRPQPIRRMSDADELARSVLSLGGIPNEVKSLARKIAGADALSRPDDGNSLEVGF